MKKLRNKITGEVNEFMIHKRIEDSEDGNPVYAPFDGNIDEWEDYDELEYWYIDNNGDILFIDQDGDKLWEDLAENRKQIGNYFETKEEAELAARKLKAWKQLKDKGFRFTGLSNESIGYEIKELSGDFALDLDLLFNGGE